MQVDRDQVYGLCGDDLAKLVDIQKSLSNEAYPLTGDQRRDLHQRLYLVLDNFVQLKEYIL